MGDLVWRTGLASIARYIPSDSEEVGVNTFARLESDEVCGYQEGGVYRQNYSELTPNLKPKPGFLSRIFRAKAPERDHLFVGKGPHKLLMSFNSRWEDAEDRPLLALITISIAPSNISKLFSLARESEGQEITPSVLVSDIYSDVSTRFNEYVGKLNRPDSWETADDIKRIENEFKMIADSELSLLGVDVDRVALNLGSSKTDNLISLEKDIARTRKRGIIEGIGAHDDSLDRMRKSQNLLTNTLGQRAENLAATSELADELAEDVLEAKLEAAHRDLLRQIEEVEGESIHAQKLRELELEGQLNTEEIKIAKANLAALESNGDNAEDQAE